MFVGDTYYQVYGSASQALFLLHSGGMAGEEWQPQIPALSTRYRVIVPDLPGHGRSLLPDDTLTVAKMGEAVCAIMDKENIQSAYVCGSSMGGAVAMWLTIYHSARVSKAVFYRIGQQKTQATYAQTQSMADPAYWQQFGLHKWLSALHEPQGGVDAWKRVIARVSEALHPEYSQHNHDIEALNAITQPVLLITGDRDPVAPLDDILTMHRAIANSGVWVMPYTTHITATNTWRKDALTEELKRFFARG